jgi:cellulose synthase/poly-beta-1,6-N-acetylglucosamine synthase-like glycosyltransferase
MVFFSQVRMLNDSVGKQLYEILHGTVPLFVPVLDGKGKLKPSMFEFLNSNFPKVFDNLECYEFDSNAFDSIKSYKQIEGKIAVKIACNEWVYKYDKPLHRIHEDVDLNEAAKGKMALPPMLISTSYANSPILSRGKASSGLGSLGMGSSSRSRSGSSAQQPPFSSSSTSNVPLPPPPPSTAFSRFFRYDDDSKYLHFYMAPIMKASNYRKHNSHEWFFSSICEGINDNLSTVFLTDCGTIFNKYCLAILLKELYLKTDLIGVTARQRVETPSEAFHPCHTANPDSCCAPCLSKEHNLNSKKDRKPCWKCWLNYFLSPAPLQGFEFEATLLLNSSMFNLIEALPVMPGPCQVFKWKLLKRYRVPQVYSDLLLKREDDSNEFSSQSSLSSSSSSDLDKISTTEALRVIMKSAEDRILSFAAIATTGYGTKWALGAVFYYEPQMTWSSLLTQRRRWINGTFASFLFFFFSTRASDFIHGGLFDDYKFSKSARLMYAFWGLPLYQLLLVFISPSVFGSSLYISLTDLYKHCPQGFRWVNNVIPGLYDSQIIDVLTIAFMGFYSIWMIYSFYVEKGKIPESICLFFVILGMLFVIPIHLSVWYSIVTIGISPVSGLVLFNLILPIFLSLPQSATSGLLYLLYLPWFLTLIIFYLLYIPAYSLARLWDSSWGNRETSKDNELKNGNENYMKNMNFRLIIGLILSNFFLTWSIVELYLWNKNIVIGIMILLFLPMFFQLLFSLFFLFIIVPLRTLLFNRNDYNQIAANKPITDEVSMV